MSELENAKSGEIVSPPGTQGAESADSAAARVAKFDATVDSDFAERLARNSRTVEEYDRHIKEYLDMTPASASTEYAEPGGWLRVYSDALLHNFQRTGVAPRVLDLGSGPRPRDGRMYRDHGFDVTLSDASPQSVESLRESGFHAKQINMITDEFGGPWDGISINGAVPHLSPEDLEKVVEKAAGSLTEGGLLAYNFKLSASASDTGHRIIHNKGGNKGYYLRHADAQEPWELRYGLMPLPAPLVYDTGGTHLWGSKVLLKIPGLYAAHKNQIDRIFPPP